jgi:hypothetical protein
VVKREKSISVLKRMQHNFFLSESADSNSRDKGKGAWIAAFVGWRTEEAEAKTFTIEAGNMQRIA